VDKEDPRFDWLLFGEVSFESLFSYWSPRGFHGIQMMLRELDDEVRKRSRTQVETIETQINGGSQAGRLWREEMSSQRCRRGGKSLGDLPSVRKMLRRLCRYISLLFLLLTSRGLTRLVLGVGLETIICRLMLLLTALLVCTSAPTSASAFDRPVYILKVCGRVVVRAKSS